MIDLGCFHNWASVNNAPMGSQIMILFLWIYSQKEDCWIIWHVAFYCWLSSWFCNSETQKTYLKCNLEIGQNRVDDTCREIVVGKKMLGSVFEGQTENQAQRPEFVLHVIGSL